jgi:hypothetical protein
MFYTEDEMFKGYEGKKEVLFVLVLERNPEWLEH